MQAGADYEHIIFDGGSTDGSQAILKGYADGDARVRLTIEPDRGQVDAINKGLALAKSDILTWLNSDDYYSDGEVLATVSRYFDENPDVDIVYGRGFRVDAKGRRLSEAFVQPAGTDFKLSLHTAIGLLQPAVFFRRRVFEAAGGLDAAYNLQLDYEYWIRIAQLGFKFGFLDRIVCNATVHEGAKSTALRLQQLDECLSLIDRRFGYVPFIWLHRYAEFFVTRQDRKVSRTIAVSDEQSEEIEFLVTRLLAHFYGAPSGRRQLVSDNRDRSPYAETWANLQKRSINADRPRRIVITSFDSAYFDQGMNLIASLHRTSFLSVDRIYVYALGLAAHERERLSQFEKVEVIDFPPEVAAFFPEYLDPKSRAYKPAAIRSGPPYVEPGDLVLWMDAGLSALQDIGEIFDILAKDEFFISDHDDQPGWPFFNIHFTHPEAQAALKLSNAELIAPHLCSCIVGYRSGGRFQGLIDEAYVLGQDPRAVLWPKSLLEHEKRKVSLDAQSRKLRNDLLRGKTPADAIDRDVLLGMFEYSGHRTQTIYSVLVRRTSAPVFSALKYHRSNVLSGGAAHANWQAAPGEVAVVGSRHNLDSIDQDVVVYHHRGTYNNLDGLRFRRKGETLFVLGNGPSLKGFPFAELKDHAWLGMNAAYRYWDETGIYPTYYCCFDDVVLDSHKQEVVRLIRERKQNGIEFFFLRENILDSYPELSTDPSVFFLERLRKSFSFLDYDMITTGSFSVLVGAVLGFRNICILGVDLNYVEKLSEAEAKGRILEIARNPESNPNYFFDGYQRQGDRYNPPNRSEGLHLRSWQQTAEILADFPIRVANLNRSSAVTCFAFDDFDRVIGEIRKSRESIESFADSVVSDYRTERFWRKRILAELAIAANRPGAIVVGGYPRSRSARMNEGLLAAKMLDSVVAGGVMVDVGAHHGSAFAPFLDRGWRIVAFEPDNANRAVLIERLAERPIKDLVEIDARAVGADSRSGVDFYRSELSTGISGLSAFHDSHQAAQHVDVVSLTDALAERHVDRVNFLKIDTEGHDLFVLRGFPWDRFTPDMIVCEFEDAKTDGLGYGWRDMAEFLTGKGYSVYVSEWHPISRYGVQHDWFGLKRYPCELQSEKAWGNLLAFRSDPGAATLATAAKPYVTVKGQPAGANEAQREARSRRRARSNQPVGLQQRSAGGSTLR